jgi:CubicO group peptidase (beta-lactamase class C family)
MAERGVLSLDVDVLAGRGNTAPVRVVSVPGERYRYAGGGYTIAQVLLEDLNGEPFHSLMEAEYFYVDPLKFR